MNLSIPSTIGNLVVGANVAIGEIVEIGLIVANVIGTKVSTSFILNYLI